MNSYKVTSTRYACHVIVRAASADEARMYAAMQSSAFEDPACTVEVEA